MYDVKITVRPNNHLSYGDMDVKTYDAVIGNVQQKFEESASGCLEVPEDYYLDIRLRYRGAEDGDLNDISPIVNINDENYRCMLKEYGDTGEMWWNLVWREDISHEGRPFFGLPGKHLIGITFFVQREEEFRVSLPVEVLATKSRAIEIKKILSFMNSEYSSISKICMDTDVDSGVLADTINSARDVCKTFVNQWGNLLRNLRHSLEPKLSITPNGMPNSPEAIHWLSLNADAIALCSPGEQVFRINNMPVRTDFAAEEHVVPSYRVYENLVIASFFNQIQSKLAMMLNFIHEHEQKRNDSSRDINRNYPDYRRYISIVRGYNTDILGYYRKSIMELQDSFYRLYRSFIKATGLNYHGKTILPKSTPFVSRTPVYSEIFETIGDWYKNCSIPISLNDVPFHSIKIDKLYEFMVLSQLINVIDSLGGLWETKEWHNMDQKKFGGIPEERPKDQPNNYYKWISESKEYNLELWYEPAIYTVKYAKKGELVVVSAENYHADFSYTPDFVVKITWNKSGMVDYLIMDAKYSSCRTVQSKSLPMLVNKYLYGIHVYDNCCLDSSIRGILAIYARGEKGAIHGYAPEHMLESRNSVFPSIEAVGVFPKDDEETTDSNLKKYISGIISKLRNYHRQEYERVLEMAKRLQES